MTEAALFYEEAKAGLGTVFFDDVQHAIDTVRERPWPRCPRHGRRARRRGMRAVPSRSTRSFYITRRNALKASTAVLVSLAVAAISGVGGFVAGGRYTSDHWNSLLRGAEARRAADHAELLQLSRAGNRDAVSGYLEHTLDLALVNVMVLNPGELSPSEQAAMRRAAQYREVVPSRMESSEWNERVDKAVQLAK